MDSDVVRGLKAAGPCVSASLSRDNTHRDKHTQKVFPQSLNDAPANEVCAGLG